VFKFDNNNNNNHSHAKNGPSTTTNTNGTDGVVVGGCCGGVTTTATTNNEMGASMPTLDASSSSSSSSSSTKATAATNIVSNQSTAAVAAAAAKSESIVSSSSSAASTSRSYLLMESGVRIHPLLDYHSDVVRPTPFCAKFRKCLRSLRLENIVQLGKYDRVILLQFGVGEMKYFLVLELYARGNLILTNAQYVAVALLRSHIYQETQEATTTAATTTTIGKSNSPHHDKKKNNNHNKLSTTATTTKKDDEKTNVAVQVGYVYPVSFATSAIIIKDSPNDDSNGRHGMMASTEEIRYAWIDEQLQDAEAAAVAVAVKTKTTKGKANLNPPPKATKMGSSNNSLSINSVTTVADIDSNATIPAPPPLVTAAVLNLKTLLLKPTSGVSHYGPALLEHCILMANLTPHVSFATHYIKRRRHANSSSIVSFHAT
jgi:hypothetical protein